MSIPFTAEQFFGVKVPPPKFGVFLSEPTADERRQAGTNVGLVVVAVIER